MARESASQQTYLTVALVGEEELIKPKSLLHFAAFNVRKLQHMGQHVALVRIPNFFKVDSCCIFETCTQNPTSIITLRIPNIAYFSRFPLHVSGDPISSVRSHAGVPIVLNTSRAGTVRLDPSQQSSVYSLVGRFDWSIVFCSYLLMRPLFAAPLRPITSSTRDYSDYFEVNVQQTLWSLLAILTPNLTTQRGQNGILEDDFLYPRTAPPTVTTTSSSFRTHAVPGEHRLLS